MTAGEAARGVTKNRLGVFAAILGGRERGGSVAAAPKWSSRCRKQVKCRRNDEL